MAYAMGYALPLLRASIRQWRGLSPLPGLPGSRGFPMAYAMGYALPLLRASIRQWRGLSPLPGLPGSRGFPMAYAMGYDRHRGGGRPPTPATPPCVRGRTQRFESVTLAFLE